MANKQIVIVGPYEAKGGVSRYVHDLVDSKRFNLKIFDTSYTDKEKITFFSSSYETVFDSGMGRLVGSFANLIKKLAIFSSFINDKEIRVVHICGVSYFRFWENAFYIIFSKIQGKKTFLHYLGAYDIFYQNSGYFGRRMIISVMNIIDKIGMLSKKSINLINNDLKHKEISYLPSSVDTDIINKFDNSSKSNQVRVIFMGGYHPIRKGLNDIVDIAPSIVKDNSDIKFFFSGSQTVKELTCDLIQNYPNNFEFIGWIPEDNKFSLLKSMDIFILPSSNEGLPYAIVEAMACGLVILAYDVGGISEIVEEGDNGFITSIGNKRSFGEILAKISKDRRKISQMSILNCKKAESELSLGNTLNKIEEIYSNLYE